MSRLRCNANVSEQMTAFQKHMVLSLLRGEMRTRDVGGGPCPAFAGAVIFRPYSPSPSTPPRKAMPPSPALGITLPHRAGKEESLGVSVMPSPRQSLSSDCSLSSEEGLRRLASHIPQCWAAWSLCGRHHTWTPTFFKRIKQNPLTDEGSQFLTFLMCFISSAAFVHSVCWFGLHISFIFQKKKDILLTSVGFFHF